MKRKLTSILLMSALLVGGASTFVSCKDYDGDQAAVQNANLTELRKLVLANQAALFGPDGNGGIVGDLASLGLTSGSGLSEQFKKDLASLSETTQTAKDALEKANAAQSTANDAKAWIEAFNELEYLRNKCEALAAIAGCKDVILQLNEMKTLWGDDLSNVVVRSELAEYLKTADLNAELEKLGYEKVDDMQADVRRIINEWTDEIAGEEGLIKDYPTLVNVVDGFCKQLPLELQKINESFKDIYTKLDIVNQMVAGLVTGINVDMVENPFWGTLNTPFGIKSTVLVGYVGREITDEKAAVFGDEEGGLAQSATGGSIFLTLNPNDIEAEGMNFTLVGRDGEEAPGYELASLVKDNSKVTTVTTRAAAVNGYKADFALTDGKKAMVNVDKGALKDVATNVLGKIKGQEGLDITSAVQTIYSTFANAVDQYYALQAAWKETQLDGSVKDRAVVSDYNIAAVTVKPLGYSSLDKVAGKVPSVPQIPELTAVLGGVVTNIDPVTVGEINGIGELSFSISDFSENYHEWSNWSTGDWGYVTSLNETVKCWTESDGTKYVEIKTNVDPSSQAWNSIDIDGDGYTDYGFYDKTTINRIIKLQVKEYNVSPYRENGVIKGAIYTITLGSDGINDLQAQLDGAIAGVTDQVNSMIDKANELAGKFDTKVISRMNRIIKKFNSLVDNAGQYLKPILLAAGKDNNVVRVSEVPGFYTKFQGAGAITLVPTSYTAELLAPAYKKMIKVDGKDITASHDGTQKTVVADLAEGKHTISVSTMDYYGEIITKNYYVEIVK